MRKHYKSCMHAKVYHQVNEYIITTSILLQLLYNDTIQKLTLIILSLIVMICILKSFFIESIS